MSDSAPWGKQWFNYSDDYDYTYTAAAGASGGAYALSNGPTVTPDATDRQAGAMPGVAAGGANNVYVPVSFENGVNPVSRALLQLNGHDRSTFNIMGLSEGMQSPLLVAVC